MPVENLAGHTNVLHTPPCLAAPTRTADHVVPSKMFISFLAPARRCPGTADV